MDSHGSELILISAATVAVLHTAIGVDHYLPFAVLAKAQAWSMRRLLLTTTVCGLGHVVASVALGLGGVFIGVGLEELQILNAFRGSLTAWLLIGFGLAYTCWGGWRLLRGRAHAHVHMHGDGQAHTHSHDHNGSHAHPHAQAQSVAPLSAWMMFVILVFGPCEALIPLMMAPAVSHDWFALAQLVAVFGGLTVLTMNVLAAGAFLGVSLSRAAFLGRYVQVLTGLTIAATGAAIALLGI